MRAWWIPICGLRQVWMPRVVRYWFPERVASQCRHSKKVKADRMARRSSALVWNTGLQRKWLKWGRSVLRIAAKPSKPSKRRSQTLQSPTMDLRVAGVRRYYLFTPPSAPQRVPSPLLVMLHGCQQSAQEFSASTRMNRLAAQEGFMVIYPEQDRLANGQGCWNWYSRSSGQAFREAESILATIDHASARYAVDPGRIVVVGFSAGASMAAQVAFQHPTRFAAVVMHSGVDPALANSTATALAAMRGSPARVKQAQAAKPLKLPPLLVLQGSLDRIVVKANGMRAASAWAAHQNAEAGAPRIRRNASRYPSTSMDWTTQGQLAATLCEISALGHAWSGGAASNAFSDPKGPDASRMVWAFAQRQFTIAS